ncbi:hypothetical protein NFI96_003806 [Prochilodus magdalenae]|nr:hypothetical protein NFI96_003806 [Prochilodus magdalenae]
MDYSLDLYTYRVSCMVSGAVRVDAEWRHREVDPLRDLSENLIQAIPRKAFRGATDIKNLDELVSVSVMNSLGSR